MQQQKKDRRKEYYRDFWRNTWFNLTNYSEGFAKTRQVTAIMEFPSLNTADGLKYLDSHLTSRSYISDCEPTQNDDTVFRALGHEPSEEFCNVLRWYRHVQSFGSHRKDLPKSSITLTIPSNSAESKGSGEEVEMKRFVNPSFLLHPLHNNVLFHLLCYNSTMLCTGQMTARLQFWLCF